MAREPSFDHREIVHSAKTFDAETADDIWEAGASGQVYSRDHVRAVILDGGEHAAAAGHARFLAQLDTALATVRADLPDAAIRPVLGLLVMLAAGRYGRPAVLRVLTRSERAMLPITAFGPRPS